MICDANMSAYFKYFIFRSLIRCSASVILLLIPSREFLISFFLLFIIVCLLFSSCSSFICCVFLCLLILLNLLCSGSPFRRLQVHSSLCFWCLLPVGKIVSVACVGFLVEGTGACVLVGGTGYCLSVGQGRIQWCVLGCL